MKLKKFLHTYPVWSAYKLHEKLVVPVQKLLKEQNITFLQSLILAALYFEEAEVTPTDLVVMFGTSFPNMSHSLKHLRLLGFVERKIDVSDSKITWALTAHAKTCLEHIIRLHHNVQEELEEELSPSEIAVFCDMAMKISSTTVKTITKDK